MMLIVAIGSLHVGSSPKKLKIHWVTFTFQVFLDLGALPPPTPNPQPPPPHPSPHLSPSIILLGPQVNS